MNLETKLIVLDQIYEIYSKFADTLETACKKYCAHCCTQNVTITTIEGYKIFEYLRSNSKLNLLERIKPTLSKKRFQPKLTTNKIAELCIQGKDIADDKNNYEFRKCPFLTNDECLIYQVRPFGCRCFVSKQNCSKIGYADVDSFIVTVNEVFLQYIEHIDIQGYFGNFADIMLFIESKNNCQHNKINDLIFNLPIKFLFVPPEHRIRIKPILNSLSKIKI